MKTRKCGYLITIIFAIMMIFSGFGFDMALYGEVTAVKASVSPVKYSGHCPKRITFTGMITLKMDKVGKYRYRWIASDGGFGPVKGGTIRKNGSVIVKSEWLLGVDGNVYKNYWKQIQILPNHYEIGSHHSYIRPLRSSNKAFFTLNCVDLSQRSDLKINNSPARMMLPVLEISGRISPKPAGCEGCLEGRKIRIVLRKEAQDDNPAKVTRHVYTLDSNSSYNYKFRSPFITAGTYTISVEKGPADQENYGNELNICFRGAEPLTRRVTLTSTNKKALNQDFKIDYTIQWGGGQALCW